MPTAEFIVEISVEKNQTNKNSNVPVANAVKYLSYADQTDLFGYHGVVEDITSRHWTQGIIKVTFRAPVAQESDIRDFLDECEMLARVENAKCLTNPNI